MRRSSHRTRSASIRADVSDSCWRVGLLGTIVRRTVGLGDGFGGGGETGDDGEDEFGECDDGGRIGRGGDGGSDGIGDG